jgi:hypothetical protein
MGSEVKSSYPKATQEIRKLVGHLAALLLYQGSRHGLTGYRIARGSDPDHCLPIARAGALLNYFLPQPHKELTLSGMFSQRMPIRYERDALLAL